MKGRGRGDKRYQESDTPTEEQTGSELLRNQEEPASSQSPAILLAWPLGVTTQKLGWLQGRGRDRQVSPSPRWDSSDSTTQLRCSGTSAWGLQGHVSVTKGSTVRCQLSSHRSCSDSRRFFRNWFSFPAGSGNFEKSIYRKVQTRAESSWHPTHEAFPEPACCGPPPAPCQGPGAHLAWRSCTGHSPTCLLGRRQVTPGSGFTAVFTRGWVHHSCRPGPAHLTVNSGSAYRGAAAVHKAVLRHDRAQSVSYLDLYRGSQRASLSRNDSM